MHKIGIIVDSFSASQLTYTFLKQANSLLERRSDIAIYGFFENLNKPVTNPNFALMNLTEVYGFDGIVVATNCLQAYQILNYPGPKRKLLYAYDVDWKRNNGLPAEFFLETFKSFEIWTRGEDYKRLIDSLFNVDSKVNETFDVEKFL